MYSLLLVLQILFIAKKHLEVADMNKYGCTFECLAIFSGQLTSMIGSALVTAAMSP
ncbi:hypothetical protein G3A_14225 [Bacillus sp. 17376]|nr:hypothetical protein G3A_14225 [Bacillus sp. 17376]